MSSRFSSLALPVAAALVGACSGDPGTSPPPPPVASCTSVTPTQLSVGQHQVIDPAQTDGCVRVPAAGAGGAEYIVAVTSGAPQVVSNGASSPYVVTTSNPGSATTAAPAVPSAAPVFQTASRQSIASEFDLMLRQREMALSQDPSARIHPAAAPAVPAPAPRVGDTGQFKACGDLQCQTFVTVTATVRYVGTHGVIYMDNAAPQNDTLVATDYQDLGNTFDNYHHPIDVTAFGNESDIDHNGLVIILLTYAINKLTPDCTNGRVLGYFYGGDLSNVANSNQAEVFYAFVPAPATATCSAISRRSAINNIKPTLIHEFQHMISFNQHVLVRSGTSEVTWLNEALSHFAEELGGRLVPDTECPDFSSCRSQYLSGDILNTYDYLTDTEGNFLVYPSQSSGTLEERGASWSFVRWVIDQFATDTIIGSDFTPRLVQTQLLGANNIVAATGGADFAQLVSEWQLANYLDDASNFTPDSDRLRYRSWGFRSIFTNPANQVANGGPFNGFPLKPDSTRGSYSHTGTLRGGSGRHFRLIQDANGPAIDFQVTRDIGGTQLDPSIVARIGIARVR